MARVIQIDTDKLNSDAKEVKSHITSIRSQLKALKEQALLLDGMWSGPGSEAFKAAFHSDLAALETIIENLNHLNEYENDVLRRFQRCERNVKETIAEIRL